MINVQKLTEQEVDALYSVAGTDNYWAGSMGAAAPLWVYRDIAQMGLLSRTDSSLESYSITDAGKDILRGMVIKAISVKIGDQPPLIFRDSREMVRDMQDGALTDEFDCINDHGDGELMFTVSAIKMNLLEIAELPEWQS